jgi:hypothetical protein
VLLAQPHGDLTRTGDGAGAALAEQIGLFEAEMIGDRLLDLVDGDAALGSAAQGRAEQGLGLVDAEGGQSGTGDGGQGVNGTFQCPVGAWGSVAS